MSDSCGERLWESRIQWNLGCVCCVPNLSVQLCTVFAGMEYNRVGPSYGLALGVLRVTPCDSQDESSETFLTTLVRLYQRPYNPSFQSPHIY